MRSLHTRLRVGLLVWLLAVTAFTFAASARSWQPPGDPERPLGTGGLEAVAPDGTALGPCPLEHTDVDVDIAGFVARVRVTQRFSNPFPDPIEAVYTFPLSHRGAVDAMWLRTEAHTIRGEIREREEARKLYEAARDRGQTAALLDQERPNIFTQQVANLMPGHAVEIEIHYVETLDFRAGAFEFSFPTVVGPRFIPGAPVGQRGTGWAPDTHRVPDASRITPPVTPEGTRAGHDLSIAVDVDAGVPIRNVESKLHAVHVQHPSPERAQVTLQRLATIPNRDFALRIEVAAEEIQSGVLTHRRRGEDGFATFLLLPPKRVTPRSAAPKELIFVIDRSGSQSGLPLQKAKETMLWILDHLNPRDTFQIVDFGSTANQLFERPQPVNRRTAREARAYVKALQANGGTMMAEAIHAVASQPADDHRLRIVTFMTDGYVGNDHEVIDLVRRTRGTSRWFPFGTGNGVNRYLIDAMAREGGGEAEYVLLNAPGEEVAHRFYERIRNPVLTDVRLEFQGLDVVDVFPQQLSDVWEERPLVVHARYTRPGSGRVIVRGYQGGELVREVIDVHLPRETEDRDALASMWARAKVEELQARDLQALQHGTFPEPLKRQIVQVALAHGILTPFTSFVAVEDRIVNEDGRSRTVTVPVEMPQGVEYEGIFGEADAVLGRAGGAFASGAVQRFAKTLSPAPQSAPPMLQERAEDAATPSPPRGRPQEGAPSRAQTEPRTDADERLTSLSADQEKRLAEPLLALIAGKAGAAEGLDLRDGRVKVKVVRSARAGASRGDLEDAGLDVLQWTEGFALGWIAVSDLEALAALGGIVSIDPA